MNCWVGYSPSHPANAREVITAAAAAKRATPRGAWSITQGQSAYLTPDRRRDRRSGLPFGVAYQSRGFPSGIESATRTPSISSAG